MKLEIFEFIDDSIDLLHKHHSIYESCARKLERFFTDSFSWKESFLNVKTRIKSEDSLREKILRQNLFTEYFTPQEMMDDLPDIIGLRIECRFIEEEKEIYESLCAMFTEEMEDGFFASEFNEGIRLDLSTPQPQIQKNGFEIYKIDGKIWTEMMTIHFELQIKSMVNVFWGEIDHKVLYKNYNYMMGEDFFRELLISIKENLWSVDKRLMQLYRRIENMDLAYPSTTKDQLKNMLSKMIHDSFVLRMREQTGILIDFKKPSVLIVDFLFAQKTGQSDEMYATFFVDVFRKIQARHEELDITKGIEIPKFEFENQRQAHLGRSIIPHINRDFKWFLLFRILIDIEQAEFEKEYLLFIDYLINTFSYRIQKGVKKKELSQKDQERMFNALLDSLIYWYSETCSMDFLTIEHMRIVESAVDVFLKDVNRPEDLLSLEDDDFIFILEELLRA